MMTGVTLLLNCSSDRLAPILMTEDRTLGPPPPNSTDFNNSGRTLALKYSSGMSSDSSSSSLDCVSSDCSYCNQESIPEELPSFFIALKS